MQEPYRITIKTQKVIEIISKPCMNDRAGDYPTMHKNRNTYII